MIRLETAPSVKNKMQGLYRFVSTLDLTSLNDPGGTAAGIHQHTGVRVDSRGQFYKIAPGVSLESVTGGVVTNENLPMLLGIPSEQVRSCTRI